MDKTELADELNQDGAQELLEQGALMRLAYNGHDGKPRVIPIGFLWNGTEIVFCTVVTSPKVSAIRSHPDVAVTIDVGATPAEAKSLLIRGPARIEIVDGVPPEYIAAARKTMDAQQVSGFEIEVNKTYEQMARISIVPAWARFYDFGAGRLPGFLQELVKQNN
jgi:hypothetical protein